MPRAGPSHQLSPWQEPCARLAGSSPWVGHRLKCRLLGEVIPAHPHVSLPTASIHCAVVFSSQHNHCVPSPCAAVPTSIKRPPSEHGVCGQGPRLPLCALQLPERRLCRGASHIAVGGRGIPGRWEPGSAEAAAVRAGALRWRFQFLERGQSPGKRQGERKAQHRVPRHSPRGAERRGGAGRDLREG